MSKIKELKNAHNWKHLARWNGEGYYELKTEDTGDVPVRLFLTPNLLAEVEEIIYSQIVNATRFPGTKLVVITPDTHYGYGVPVGCVLLTDAEEGAIAMGPVGYDIGCFTADTLVPTLRGVLTIGNLAESSEAIPVYAWSADKKGVVQALATAKKTRTNAPLVKVKLDNEREIICTPDHEFMLADGSYLQAQELTSQTPLKSFELDDLFIGFTYYTPPGREGQTQERKTFKVVSVEPLDYTADVYCLTVPEYGNFALDAGVFVHNCGMVSAKSDVDAEAASPENRLAFNRAVMSRVNFGAGGKSVRLKNLDGGEFNNLIRGGAQYYVEKYGASFDRSRAERHRLPVDDDWQAPFGGKGQPERGIQQLGSLGGGNHFIELQRAEETGTLFVQAHTGSRGWGHGLATNYFELARAEKPDVVTELDLGYFTPESKHYRGYQNAVAAGGNFAIINRLILFEQVAEAFKEVFDAELELIYEISHNLVQKEWHPEFGDVWVHRKGATRAFPAGHAALKDTMWEDAGHPVLIPGSNKDWSYILRPQANAVNSGYSVNHGAGRRMSRAAAVKNLNQRKIDDEYREAGILVNDNGHVPIDEAAACYKPAEEVIAAVVGAGLATIEYSLWPLASLKGDDGRRAGKFKKHKKHSSKHF